MEYFEVTETFETLYERYQVHMADHLVFILSISYKFWTLNFCGKPNYEQVCSSKSTFYYLLTLYFVSYFIGHFQILENSSLKYSKV